MNSKYLKFSNKADTVSRIGLEKLGYSTKRNDPTTIGQFGSGIKFAPIAALRNGWKWHFLGKDNRGVYHLEYTTVEEDGIECIYYMYEDELKPSSFTIDAGVLSWLDAFQIYREAVANAMDAVQSRDDWYISVVDKDEVVYEDGWFNCFVTASPELMEVHRNFDKYFCINRTPVAQYVKNHDGRKLKVFHKVDPQTRIYSNNVLVFATDKFNSIFDYDIQGIALNEERSVKSHWDIEIEVAIIISMLVDKALFQVF